MIKKWRNEPTIANHSQPFYGDIMGYITDIIFAWAEMGESALLNWGKSRQTNTNHWILGCPILGQMPRCVEPEMCLCRPYESPSGWMVDP